MVKKFPSKYRFEKSYELDVHGLKIHRCYRRPWLKAS